MSSRTHRAMRYGLPPVLWALMIFGLSSLSNPPQPEGWTVPLGDKWAHMFLFAVLAFLVFRAFRFGLEVRFRAAAVLAFVLASFYGAFDEWHQSFVPDRDVELWDWVADTAGAALVLIGAWRVAPGEDA